jgi:intracellular sulfur oxidation DsrE/DsrF family protein
MSDSSTATPRRSFIAAFAAAAAAVGLGKQAPAAAAAETGAGTSFQAWLDGIPGKYRQVYDAPSPNNGFALTWSHVYLLTGAEGYNVPESELGVVVVLRHSAIPIAMQDEVWAKYQLGEHSKINDPATKAPALRNPFAFIKPGDMPLPEAALEKLIGRGVRVAVCGTAIHFQSMRIAKAMGLPHETVKNDFLAAVIPGVQVVPSGVLAVNGAQTKGCTYCFAG